MFETLGKLHANYAYHLYQRAHAAGKPIHCHSNSKSRSPLGLCLGSVWDFAYVFMHNSDTSAIYNIMHAQTWDKCNTLNIHKVIQVVCVEKQAVYEELSIHNHA